MDKDLMELIMKEWPNEEFCLTYCEDKSFQFEVVNLSTALDIAECGGEYSGVGKTPLEAVMAAIGKKGNIRKDDYIEITEDDYIEIISPCGTRAYKLQIKYPHAVLIAVSRGESRVKGKRVSAVDFFNLIDKIYRETF